jgi:predicted nucleotidyltransferase
VSPQTERAAKIFLARLRDRYELREAYLFGSRARDLAEPDSDADIAVLLRGRSGPRVDTAVDMAGIAFDVMLETGILVDPLPLWEEEWEHPERFRNPALIKNIRRDGVRL